jgi:hypothetical protein
MVAAQSALETAGWVGGMWDWNLGNITQPNLSLAVYQPGNDLPFAKYASLAAGAAAMVALLTAKGVIQHAAAGGDQRAISNGHTSAGQLKRRSDQLIVVSRHIFRAPQPVTHATGAQAGNTEAILSL